MVAVLVGLLVGLGVLLWSGRSAGRLRTLLGGGTGLRGDDIGGRPKGAVTAGTAASARGGVSDEELAFDLDLVAICLTAGLPIPVALTLTAEATADRSGLLRIARGKTIGGEDLADDDRLRPVLEVFAFSEHTGVGPAPLIESVAGELRAASRRRRQEAAAALGVRLVVPLGVCILPAFLLLSVVPVVISLLTDLTTVFF
ncbi:type II secretion system F family protein [Brevibacterium casei]|uniref:type II secretion system F family protein n=1 Tax=Brevibacterium casei TaxID=33889 RepID=UPI00223B74FA|nr:type II secretion system F family protein [Brevibacterium casei]MCT1549461.1 type II secretion system F family protein [Brevibacterium casei]MCT1561340.1 type II secretion system F family protein [Brevibacterium casei]MCT2208536.1 type II secretion system F family protein [Brevibacterium casei]